MNREIKFRAWRKDKKVFSVSKHNHVCFDGRIFLNLKDPYNDCPKQEDVVLMQYTGLKDKNGKEIYEGDILERYDCTKCCNKRVWITTGYVKWTGQWYETLDNLDAESGYGLAGNDEREVVGNIYENPELLKEE